MYSKRIICLANSRKPPSGRCIAGKTLGGSEWIRPVSARPTHEVSEDERRYNEGSKAQLLDIIDVPLERHDPMGHQAENHVLATGHYWTKRGVATKKQVLACIDPYDPDYWAATESTYRGLQDKVPADQADGLRSSLKLIQPDRLLIIAATDDGYDGGQPRRRVRGEFVYGPRQYRLIVTDPVVEEWILKQGDGEYRFHQTILCISLAEVWPENDYASRLIATIITDNRLCGQR